MKIDWSTKLAIFQHTPKSVIKERKIWWETVKYVPVGYVERVLNFVSNFKRWIQVVDKWIKAVQVQTSKWPKDAFDAWVQCDCYIYLWDHRIERSVFWSWRMFKNKSISDFTAYEAARSQATKSFADTLWIWSDKAQSQDDRDVRKWKFEEVDEIDLSWFTPITEDKNGLQNKE